MENCSKLQTSTQKRTEYKFSVSIALHQPDSVNNFGSPGSREMYHTGQIMLPVNNKVVEMTFGARLFYANSLNVAYL